MKHQPKTTPLLPKETVEIAARRELLVGGVCGIADYSPERIGIRTGEGILAVCGNHLTMCWAGEKRLMLRGQILSVTMEKERP